MATDNLLQEDSPLINLEKLEQTLSFYKFPLILSGIGICLFLVAIMLLFKNQKETALVFLQDEASVSAKTQIKADIGGAVALPGVYTLPEGSRILDLLSAAGGFSSLADQEWINKNLNQAAKLVDGGKIYIPSKNEAASGKAGSNESSLNNLNEKTISLNNASQAQLETLPGVGPVTADKIISGRPYQTIEELKSKKIVGTALFEKIKDLIDVY